MAYIVVDVEADDANELFQAMTALDNIGEPIFQSRASASVDEEAINRRLADEYLKRECSPARSP